MTIERRKPNAISQEDWDSVDSPPLSSEFISGMRPVREAAPELIALEEHVRKQRGRPKAMTTKRQTTLRLSPEVIAHFKKKGPGWQTRIDKALRELIESKRPSRTKLRRPRKVQAKRVARRA